MCNKGLRGASSLSVTVSHRPADQDGEAKQALQLNASAAAASVRPCSGNNSRYEVVENGKPTSDCGFDQPF